MRYTAVYHDGADHWVFETRRLGPAQLRYGVLVRAGRAVIGPEQPVASIAGFLPYSDFQVFTGALPEAIRRLIDAAPEPADGSRE